jgi:hypothetical protein
VLAGVVVLAAGVWRVWAGNRAAGRQYPAYSTLNAGPLGARAVGEALGRLEGMEVGRNLLPLRVFRGDEGTTLVLAGAGEAVFGPDTDDFLEPLEAMMRDGVRVVVALNPRAIPVDGVTDQAVVDPWRAAPGLFPPGKRGVPGGSEALATDRRVSAGERWGFQFQSVVHPGRAPAEGYAVEVRDGGPPEVPRWFSVWRWAGLDPSWTELATVDGRPVVVRRAFGRGSLTLLSDTVFLSNEALWRAPAPGFLLWLLASGPRLVFDETRHGTVSSPGVMHLVRRYRLSGFLLGAGVLLALFIWRAGTSLMPVQPGVAEAPGAPLAGAEGLSGFSNLLRQTIPPRRLLGTCVDEWERSPFVRRRVDARTIAAVRDLVAAAGRNPRAAPVAVYREVAGLLGGMRAGNKKPTAHVETPSA